VRILIVVVFLLAASIATSRETPPPPGNPATEIGALEGVQYRIDVPAEWNRSLVVFYHGYSTTPVTFEKGERISPMFDGMLKRGYAVIQSAYSRTGWAVGEGFADTERLRKYFVGKHGAPKETFASGLSMGGTLTMMTMETRADLYAGGLSMCGALEPSDRLMQRDFALRAAFDYYFPGVLGALDPVPADFQPTGAIVAKVIAAMRAKPAATQALLRLYGVADAKTLADVFAFNTFEIKEMQERTGGNPFGNADLLYTGSGDDFALNDGVRRYRADAKLVPKMAKFYTPTGKLTKPLLALHDVGDPLVPASTAFEYAVIAQREGNGDNFVQRYVNKEGHCVFTPDEVDRVFGELLDWVHSGKRPESGKLR